jgi:amidophosphoribosyltransferase
VAQRDINESQRVNCVKAIYEPFTDIEVSTKIAEMLVNNSKHPISAKVDILYQTLEGMHRAIPNHPGDWYFSGDYPTAGGNRLVNEAYIDFYEKNFKK